MVSASMSCACPQDSHTLTPHPSRSFPASLFCLGGFRFRTSLSPPALRAIQETTAIDFSGFLNVCFIPELSKIASVACGKVMPAPFFWVSGNDTVGKPALWSQRICVATATAMPKISSMQLRNVDGPVFRTWNGLAKSMQWPAAIGSQSERGPGLRNFFSLAEALGPR